MRGKVVKIRCATVADAERISELLREVALQFIVDEFQGGGRALYLQQLAPEVTAKRLADTDFRFLVAEDGDAMVGVAALQDNWHLYHGAAIVRAQNRLFDEVQRIAQRTAGLQQQRVA